MKSRIDEVGFWHARFTQQATWTERIFFTLAEDAGFSRAACALEVGCGTGAALKRLSRFKTKTVMGLDIRKDFLQVAENYTPFASLVLGDAHSLPFPDAQFDLTYCHFLLMWTQDPVTVLREMKRVTGRAGWVVVLAEPDYDHRIDMPESLVSIGKVQTDALRLMGADPGIGRRLSGLFREAGIRLEATGLLGGYWSGNGLPAGWELEWQTLRYDLEGYPGLADLDDIMNEDRDAWLQSVRILYVPLFYAVGRVD